MIMKEDVNVLVIDPRGYKTSHYCNGICSGLSSYCQLTLATSYHYQNNTGADYRVEKLFFKKSDKMDDGKRKKIVRGLEYIQGYKRVLELIKENNYDVVHIEWCIFHPIDCYFIKKIRKYVKKLVFTAHNVIGHVGGENEVEELRELYSLFDIILVHGLSIKDEFKRYFPDLVHKVKIQFHGTFLDQPQDYDLTKIDKDIVKKISSADKVYIFFGYIFYNKGTDILLRNCRDVFGEGKSLLIVAGSVRENYQEFIEAKQQCLPDDRIILLEGYVEDNLLNYLIYSSDIILLPYRHASMSGVVFSAAEFSKPVLCTDTGSLNEYLESDVDSFVCSPEDFVGKWLNIERNCSKEELCQMGNKLNWNIQKKYDWNTIAEQLVILYQE